MKLVVIENHKSNYPNPISFDIGDPLIVGKRDKEFKGWIWVQTQDGNEGWAPEEYLNINRISKKAIAKHNYFARELDTCKGENLILHYELKGWGWVENKDGCLGWIPLKTTKTLKSLQ